MAAQYEFEQDVFAGERRRLIPDIAFSPDGDRIALTYSDTDEVEILDSATLAVIRRYENPGARLDGPHGVLLTDRHLIVTNMHHHANRPSTLAVYDLDREGDSPVHELPTPRRDLREAHSLALDGDRLVVTYAEQGPGALACYHFDRNSGVISGPVTVIEDWFSRHGQPKGVAFNPAGDRLVVTFATEKKFPTTLSYKARKARWLLQQKGGPQRLARALLARTQRALSAQPDNPIDNGIALFDIDEEGRIAPAQTQLVTPEGYCRLENAHIVDTTCAIVDTVNSRVLLYEMPGDRLEEPPAQVISDRLSFPHDACLSPGGDTLVVSNLGLRIDGQHLVWHEYTPERSDKLSVFRLRGQAPAA